MKQNVSINTIASPVTDTSTTSDIDDDIDTEALAKITTNIYTNTDSVIGTKT